MKSSRPADKLVAALAKGIQATAGMPSVGVPTVGTQRAGTASGGGKPIAATVSRSPEAADRRDDWFDDLPAVGEFTRLSLWMAGSVAGLRTAVHTAQAKHFRGLARRLGWEAKRKPRRPAVRPTAPDDTMALLADALVGTSRSAIVSVYGLPRCAADGRDVLTGADVWDGRVWYFPLTHPSATLVGVEFDDDREHARRVVFVSMDDAAAA